jgi:hypothetical protein
MPHVPTKAVIPKAVQDRIDKIPTVERNGLRFIEDFALLIDTHRDQPHVGVLHPDIHRGMCLPTKVDYIVGDDLLYDPATKKTLQRHDKHLFVEEDWFGEWLMNYLITNGSDPRDGDGVMPTSHFRDARAKRYDLKSFRQIVVARYEREIAKPKP